jgi:hypothetical protein
MNQFASFRRLALSAISFAALLGACSSSSSQNAGPTDDAFCSAYKADLSACPTVLSPACEQAQLAEFDSQCATIAADYSAAFRTAVVNCPAAAGCPFGDPFATACFRTALSSLSSAQTKLATDYCATCGGQAGTATCMAEFWGTQGDAGGVAVSEPGAGALQASDAVVEQIDSKCVPAPDAGALACLGFTLCQAGVLLAASPPTPSACGSQADAGSSNDGG